MTTRVIVAGLSMFLSLVFVTPPAYGIGKMDLPLKMLVGQVPIGKAILGKAVRVQAGVQYVEVLIKSSDPDLTAADIGIQGGKVRAVIGDIMTARVPVALLPGLEARGEITRVEGASRLRFLMDSARANTKVDKLQDGTADGTSYNGENVVAGVIDSGLDYSRSDFKDADGNTRVQYLRFQSASGSSVTTSECTKSHISGGTCSIAASNDSTISHGTHVTGIAAGSDATYKGVAPAADIMFVRSDFTDDLSEGTSSFSSSIIDGVDAIFEKSDTIDKAAVVNLSVGTHIGAHDDTSLLEQALGNAIRGQYATSGKSYGRAVVAAAGNEHLISDALGSIAQYAGGIHASFSVSAETSHGYRLWVLSSDPPPTRVPLIVDVWFGQGQASHCSAAAKVYPFTNVFGSNLSAPSPATTTDDAEASTGDLPLSTDNGGVTSSTSDNKATIIMAVDSSDSQNSKPRALISFGPGSSGEVSDLVPNSTAGTGYLLDVIIRSTAASGTCSGDIWLEGGGTYTHFLKGIDTGAWDVSGTGSYTIQSGDNNKTVTLPGTASGVIAVGAYLQEKPYGSGRSQWTDINGTVHDATDLAGEPAAANVVGGTVGQRSPFSSIGPAAYSYSGRKPDILAPGDPIISTLATGYSPESALKVDSTHMKLVGTSQSSPHIAGVVALLYQKNNCLTAAQVRSALTSTASLASSPNDQDGYGKVDASAAMGAVTADTSCYSGTGDLEETTSTSSSTSGCGNTILPVATGAGALSFAFLLLPGVAIAIRRRFWIY